MRGTKGNKFNLVDKAVYSKMLHLEKHFIAFVIDIILAPDMAKMVLKDLVL